MREKVKDGVLLRPSMFGLVQLFVGEIESKLGAFGISYLLLC